MAAVIATERRLRTRMPGREFVAQNAVNWRTVRGYGELWRGRTSRRGAPRSEPGGWRKPPLKTGATTRHTGQSTPTFLCKNKGAARKSSLAISDRSARV